MQLRYKDFSFPRWLIFVGMLVPIWWLGRGIVKVLVFIIEGAFFTQKRALYYIMGTKVYPLPPLLCRDLACHTHLGPDQLSISSANRANINVALDHLLVMASTPSLLR